LFERFFSGTEVSLPHLRFSEHYYGKRYKIGISSFRNALEEKFNASIPLVKIYRQPQVRKSSRGLQKSLWLD